MSWLTWRQYRLQAVVTAALLAACCAVLLVSGLQVAAQWHADLTACTLARACGNPSFPLLGGWLANDLTGLCLAVPGVLGILVGAPLAAAEIDSGTVNFAWTQGVSRARWLAVKAGWLLLAAAVIGGTVGGLVTWWSGPRNAAYGSALAAGYFDVQGIVPIGYAVFAVALGIAAGALLRRTLPAVAVTLAVFIGARLAVAQLLRQHFLPPATDYSPVLSNSWPEPRSPNITLSEGMADRYGHAIPERLSDLIAGMPATYLSAACRRLAAPFTYQAWPGSTEPIRNPTAATQRMLDACIRASGVRNYVSYQPASHYWPFQFIETGIFLAAAAVLVAVAFAAVRHLDA